MIEVIKTKYEGYDHKKMERFYKRQYQLAKKSGKSDEEAHKIASFLLDYYKHQFRKYV